MDPSHGMGMGMGMRSPTSPPPGYALPTPPNRPSPPSSYNPPGAHGQGQQQQQRVSSRSQLGRRPSGLTSQLGSPISPTGAGGYRSPQGQPQQQGMEHLVQQTSPLSARSQPSGGIGAPDLPPLPPGAAPSSFSPPTPTKEFAPPTPSKMHARRPSQEGMGRQQYQAMPSAGSGSVGQAGRGDEGMLAPRPAKPVIDLNHITAPLIPQLPPSPSLDMAYFSGQSSAPHGSTATAPPASYFSSGPPLPSHSSREARLASLAAAGGVETPPPASSVSTGEGEGEDDVFESQTARTAMTSVSSIGSTASLGLQDGRGAQARPPADRKDTLSPPVPAYHQASRPGSPARSTPSPLGAGYDAKLLPPRGPPSRSVSSSVVSTSSSQGSNGSAGSGGARMEIIASSNASRNGGKRTLPAPPPQTVRKSPSREGRDLRMAPQPRSVSAGALYHQQGTQQPAPPAMASMPRQPSPLAGGARADGIARRTSPQPWQQPQPGGRLTNRDLPPILTPKASGYPGSPPQAYHMHGPPSGRASPIDRRSSGSPLAGPPRSASLAASSAMQSRASTRGPQSAGANGQYGQRQPSGGAHDYPMTPTSAAVDSIIEEMLHSSQEGSTSPRSPRTVTRKPSVAGSENGSVLDRPRPSKKSSEYTIRPSSTGRSPTPQQGGFPSFRQISGTQHRYYDGSAGRGRRRATLVDALVQEPFQMALFPHLSIASFLALLGAIPADARRMVSGEIVGRWVCREWGVTIGNRETWPGLQVWEGFLESLLHDPTAFPTYPAHFQPLLQHLSLSHTLIVLFLRSLPPGSFPDAAPFPWEDEGTSTAIGLPNSQSAMTLSSFAARSRAASGIDQDNGRPPKAERVLELVMPEPLGVAKPEDDVAVIEPPNIPQPKEPVRQRRGSLGSASLVSWRHKERRGSESTASSSFANSQSSTLLTAPSTGSRKAPLPPVSFPKPKRYVFRSHPDEPAYGGHRSRHSSESGRPGSVFSVDDTLSLSGAPPMPQINRSLYRQRRAPSESGSSNFRSSAGRHSPSFGSNLRYGSNALGSRTATSSPTASRFFRNDFTPPIGPVEPAFDKPLPIVQGRVPVLRVFVPLSEQVRSWPCLEGAKRARAELERAGAWTKLKVGDVIINTALQDPLLPRHLMLYSPSMQPFLVPLEYRYSPDGHLPGYIDAFVFPPSYYFPLLPAPYIVHLDLSPFAERALPTLRLAFDRRDVTTARGDKVVAKRYLQVAGFQITPADSSVSEDWEGMITLEADGTAEGRNEILQRLGRSPTLQEVRPVVGAWEIVKEKSLGGSVWLRLCQEAATPS